jgi:predicted GH43/DUF377 family glycosyl hydrolase
MFAMNPCFKFSYKERKYKMKTQRSGILIKSDPNRVLLRPFFPVTEDRARKVITRIMALSETETGAEVRAIINDFNWRHHHLKRFFLQRVEQLRHLIPTDQPLSEERKLLIGAYFSHEYSIEAAALFNPSMVWHPDQSGLAGGSRRFIISLRATGERHISSLTFRSGVIDASGIITLGESSRFTISPEIVNNTSGHEARFEAEHSLEERVIFPNAAEESNGIEDARFVEFQDDDGSITYYATYTAYDGHHIRCRLLETKDFLNFKFRSLQGKEVQNKGPALFPRRVNGHYAMLSRQDNENNYIMFSDQVDVWDSKKLLLEPVFPWEYVQMGNCGSPVETDAGWLVLSHGVGPMRKYAIGAFLLDLDDPARVIGRQQEPMIVANQDEREGYVPNVVYSCGSQIHNGKLIIPYAMSDYTSGFVTVDLAGLLKGLSFIGFP